MTLEDEIFNQLVQLDILDYELASSPHTCRCCGFKDKVTYKLKFEEDGDEDVYLEKPYLYICKDCYDEAKLNVN